ncbi:MAG: thioredoxin domain-containing protein [Acidimicrobiales bacterium]
MTGKNHLAGETSPYLLQHQDNPVDWYPWGDEAFELARRQDKPVILSVGYSACHWCHVMAHESFEDPATARAMNADFVCIKVDREERPDIDAVYMEAVQATTGSGGWPMTVFMTPKAHPFMAGTYFPPEDRHGLPGFPRVLEAVARAWQERRDELVETGQELRDAVEARTRIPARTLLPGTGMLDQALLSLSASFDPTWGGFGPAPKFPQPSMIDLALRAYSANDSPTTLSMATTTLGAMAAGGIRDHLGGGFARYSTDARWLVPHFEKMLYDQAGLLRVYIHAWQLTSDPTWLELADEIATYVSRDLRHPDGGLYSAEDADSEGAEGRFYVWTPSQIEEVLGPEQARVAMEFWGVTSAGNFEGANILHRPLGSELTVRDTGLAEARSRLFEARRSRIRPGLDSKILTEWNAMYASALAQAAAATGRTDWAHDAAAVMDFLIRNSRRDSDGRWLRSWQNGQGHHLAYAGDYAWLTDAFTRLGELTGKAVWIDQARATADSMVDLFIDGQGCLFTTGSDAEELIVRPQDILDGAIPAANSVACVALQRLGALTGQRRYSALATDILAALAGPMADQPRAFAHALGAVDTEIFGTTSVVVTGDRQDLVGRIQGRYLPRSVLAWGERYDSPLWEGRSDNLAFVCQGYTCRTPSATLGQLDRALDETRHPPAPGRHPPAPGRSWTS